MSRVNRENFLITGFVCIVFGAFLSVANLGSFAITIGMFGIVFFLTGMTMSRQVGLSPEAVAAWQPDGEPLPDAGRIMFRVDVTLDEPISSSILCGPCGHVEVREGTKPSHYTCKACNSVLWEEE